jgi:hypothetical protein
VSHLIIEPEVARLARGIEQALAAVGGDDHIGATLHQEDRPRANPSDHGRRVDVIDLDPRLSLRPKRDDGPKGKRR